MIQNNPTSEEEVAITPNDPNGQKENKRTLKWI
jgi:hypothetical protein